MTLMCVCSSTLAKSLLLSVGLLLSISTASAGILEDDEARKAILELRQRVELNRTDLEQAKQSNATEKAGSSQSLLDLQRQIELLRGELATLRGANEHLAHEMSSIQRQQKDAFQSLTERIGKLEPVKVAIDGVEFFAEASEKRAFEMALASFKKGEFATAQNLLAGFIGRYPASLYVTSALFWLGNAQYATRDYKEAISNFRALVAKDPAHLRAPEALLSVANCQLELKDSKSAKKSLVELIKAYPQSLAAGDAKQRLADLK